MSASKLIVSTLVSLSIGLTPLLASANQVAIGGGSIEEQISTNENLIHKKLLQMGAINAALNVTEPKTDRQDISVFYGIGVALAGVMTSNTLGELSNKLDKSDLQKLESFKAQATTIADNILDIIKPFEQLRSIYFEQDYWHMEVEKNADALKKLDALAASLNKDELKSVTLIIAKIQEGSWFRVRNALAYYPESSFQKAVSRMSGRAKAIYYAGTAALAAALAGIGYSGFKIMTTEHDTTPPSLPSEANEMATVLINDIKSVEGEAQQAKINAIKVRLAQLSAEIIKLQQANDQLKVSQVLQ